jgi:hypothetical protein
MTKQLRPCPDCGAYVGELHRDGCDVQRCPHCGWSALGCQQFDPHDPRRQVWDGKWPGEADCERLGFFVNDDASAAKEKTPTHPQMTPGLSSMG